jgi:hypothetical protein
MSIQALRANQRESLRSPAFTPRRPRRKRFREIQGIPHDRNAKARIWSHAKYYNAEHRREGQHRGPITWAAFRVLRALLWGFHNGKSGKCHPSYESIAAIAQCSRDTVYAAINTLYACDILDWEQRWDKKWDPDREEFLPIRISNAYIFRDPWPCATTSLQVLESENPAGTLTPQEKNTLTPPKIYVLNPQEPLDRTLIEFGKTLGHKFDQVPG